MKSPEALDSTLVLCDSSSASKLCGFHLLSAKEGSLSLVEAQ